jgi:hypothetical protein
MSIMGDMAIRNKRRTWGIGLGFYLRSVFVVLGLVGIWWGLATYNAFSQNFPVERVARGIIADEPFKFESLAQQLPAVESIEAASYCRPAALRSAAIIRIRIMEAVDHIDSHTRDAEQRSSVANFIRRSLSCSPADPFLWFVLYGLEFERYGFRSDDLKYLEMSYRLGPNEGWIEVKRNRLLLSELKQLPPDLGEQAIRTFLSLVDSAFTEQAAATYAGLSADTRDSLAPRLKEIPARKLEQFSWELQMRGVRDDRIINMQQERRPWQR